MVARCLTIVMHQEEPRLGRISLSTAFAKRQWHGMQEQASISYPGVRVSIFEIPAPKPHFPVELVLDQGEQNATIARKSCTSKNPCHHQHVFSNREPDRIAFSYKGRCCHVKDFQGLKSGQMLWCRSHLYYPPELPEMVWSISCFYSCSHLLIDERRTLWSWKVVSWEPGKSHHHHVASDTSITFSPCYLIFIYSFISVFGQLLCAIHHPICLWF